MPYDEDELYEFDDELYEFDDEDENLAYEARRVVNPTTEDLIMGFDSLNEAVDWLWDLARKQCSLDNSVDYVVFNIDKEQYEFFLKAEKKVVKER
jgi:hypothetical protein